MNLSDAAIMAKQALREHGLSPEWCFYFDQSKQRFGACHYRLKSISLSPYLVELNSEYEVRDTVLHEIAHALAYVRFSVPQGHNHLWRAICVEIGANPKRVYESVRTGGTVQTVSPNYIGTCPNCGTTITRLRLKKASEIFACKSCCDKYNGGMYSEQYKFVWRRG